MGFITPTHAWEETDAEVIVRVDIKGVPRSSLDVFASSCYLKVNAPPYLFSCDLEGEIDDAECVATVDAAGVSFRCPKLVPGTTWGRLGRETGGPSSPEARAATAERRRASVAAAHARVTAEKKAAQEKKAQVDKAYLEKQWELERTRRETIERRQEEEMAEESGGLLAEFVDHIVEKKVVVLEELAAEFGLRTQDAVSRVQALEQMGRITGVMDDRGKFIFISRDEMAEVAAFINRKGRVAIAELARKSSDFVKL